MLHRAAKHAGIEKAICFPSGDQAGLMMGVVMEMNLRYRLGASKITLRRPEASSAEPPTTMMALIRNRIVATVEASSQAS